MEDYKVALFGHRDLCEHRKLEKKIYPILEKLILEKTYVQFYIGRNGEFDIFTASIIRRAKKAFGYGNVDLTLALPYKVKDIEFYANYYDSVIIPESIEKIHPKRAITMRNRWMVEQCNLVICFVNRDAGGAYTALEYATKLGKKIINLAINDVED